MQKEIMKKLQRSEIKREDRRETRKGKYGIYKCEREGITIKPPFVNLTLNLPPTDTFQRNTTDTLQKKSFGVGTNHPPAHPTNYEYSN